jgi:hypothetical protein
VPGQDVVQGPALQRVEVCPKSPAAVKWTTPGSPAPWAGAAAATSPMSRPTTATCTIDRFAKAARLS